MNPFQIVVRTRAPGSFLFLRVFVGADYILDGMRAIRDSTFFGASRLERIFGLATEHELVLGAFELVCGAFVWLGFLTRIGAVAPCILPALIALRVLDHVGGTGTAWALDELIASGGIFILALVLTVSGGGAWSVDATIAED